jgi:hypothetical protein
MKDKPKPKFGRICAPVPTKRASRKTLAAGAKAEPRHEPVELVKRIKLNNESS